MQNDHYLASSADIKAALQHLRNKIISLDFERPDFRQKLIRRIWNRVSASYSSALGEAASATLVISEQAIENAFVLRTIRPEHRTVLDFGAYESTLPITLAALGHQVTVLDQRRYPFACQNLNVETADILRPNPAMVGQFDFVYSVSTIEHIGLGRYGDPEGENADQLAVTRLWEKVRPGGTLLITVPAGAASVQRGYRVYPPERLRALLPARGDIRYFKKNGRRGIWAECGEMEITGHVYENYFAQTPVEGLAIAVVTKPDL